jgi:glycosyltransferase involved in cell wall biosynthesis
MSQTMLTNAQDGQAAGRKRVSAIVPVFNEEKTVGRVVEALAQSTLTDEVICVNDGSTDGSLAILETLAGRTTVINLSENHGKGYALVTGIRAAQGEIVAFFDADLANLSDEHIGMLLAPVLEGRARVSLGYPTKDALLSVLPSMLSDLTGERAYFREDLLPWLAKMETTRFGVEVLLNNAFREHRPMKVPLTGLRGLYKYEKHAPTKAFREYLGAAIEIAEEIGRIDGLLPEDRRIIDGLGDVSDAEELSHRVTRIRSATVRHFLEKYVLGHLRHHHEQSDHPE